MAGDDSILTVPVLVYLFGISPLTAISYSLFVVGSTSLVGTLNSYRKGLVDIRTTFLFGISSLITVFVTRKFIIIIPLIPKHFVVGGFTISFDILTMVLFAVLMLVASISMIKNKSVREEGTHTNKPNSILFLLGIAIGLITGFLGAGGGFLLIPALVLYLHLPMQKAVGTSLLIIALVGFLGDTGLYKTDWIFLIVISLIAITGVIAGGLLGKKIRGENLKKGFGWFVLLMGIYIIVKEFFL